MFMPKISKRMVGILALSVLVWFVSGFIQVFLGWSESFMGYRGCNLTGFPIALCILGNDGLVWAVSIANILIWFVVLQFLGKYVGEKNRN